jgi:RNA polymerase sigma-70 factor, ECF subfamily
LLCLTAKFFVESEPFHITLLDKPAFELLFKTNFKSLTLFSQKYVKDIDMAKEIVQEVFLNLWEKRTSIDLSKSVKSYLMTSVYNKSLNYLRDMKKFDSNVLSFEGLYPMNEGNIKDSLVAKELARAIQETTDDLPEKCREIFILNRHHNLKYREIADKLDISVKTVEAQMSKALQHFRIKLAEFLTLAILIFHFKNLM